MPSAAPAQSQLWNSSSADLGDDDGGDDEVMAAQAEAGIAERHARSRAEITPPPSMPNHGSTPNLVNSSVGGVGAEPEIQRVAERDLPAIAGEDVPALRQRRIHQRQHHDVLDVDVLDEQRHHARRSRRDRRRRSGRGGGVWAKAVSITSIRTGRAAGRRRPADRPRRCRPTSATAAGSARWWPRRGRR